MNHPHLNEQDQAYYDFLRGVGIDEKQAVATVQEANRIEESQGRLLSGDQAHKWNDANVA